PLLRTLQEAELIPFEKKILIGGTISQIEELKRIHSIKNAFPTFIHDESIPSESLTELGMYMIQKWIDRNQKLGDFNLEKTNHNILLSIHVKDHKLTPQILKDIEFIYPRTEIDLDKNRSDYPSVHFQVYLLEIQKNFIQSI